MVNSIVNFAETGVPDVSKMSSVTWPPVDPKDVRQLVINDVIDIAPYPKTSLDAIEFWNSLNLTDIQSTPKTSHT
ncbi:unnamed protein product [Allacma fusca]|uniref:Uncharacterized protein n=1 Tax=Allacma fusca TaxID=39272 RepID=A0A8J2L185_9HEXA|nr:unnamed protein product [Allacma fusca]